MDSQVWVYFSKTAQAMKCLVLILFQEVNAFTPQQPLTNEDDCENEEKLKVLTWNIYMLPWMVPGNHKRERAYSIVDEIRKSDFDVIVFQEAFFVFQA